MKTQINFFIELLKTKITYAETVDNKYGMPEKYLVKHNNIPWIYISFTFFTVLLIIGLYIRRKQNKNAKITTNFTSNNDVYRREEALKNEKKIEFVE